MAGEHGGGAGSFRHGPRGGVEGGEKGAGPAAEQKAQYKRFRAGC